MRLEDYEQRFRAALQELDLAHMHRMIDHYRSAGIKSPNWDGTSRGAPGSRTLTHDPLDRRGLEDLAKTIQDVQAAIRLIDAITRRQSFWVRVADAVPDPAPTPCENPNCEHVADGTPLDRLRPVRAEGRSLYVCDRCRKHTGRHGRLWPFRADGSRIRTADAEHTA